MTEKTKQNALKKAEKFTVNVGYDDHIRNDTLLNADHSEVSFQTNS